MGSQGSKSKASARSNEKDKKVAKKKKGHLRVLTLGISGSGKSTFAKQMKILYCGGFTDDEKKDYKSLLFKNIVAGMQELTKHASTLGLEVSEGNRKKVRLLNEMNVVEVEWSADTCEKLQELWKDPAIQEAWARAPEHHILLPMLEYHMGRLDQYMSENYEPTNDDVLRARQRTTGSVENTCEIEKYVWTFIDAGGQKPERNKWETILGDQNINAVIFFAALDEYNTPSIEEPGLTKLQVALKSFKEVITSERTKSLTVLLFLNKQDLFAKKIKTQKSFESFQTTFPAYKGGQDVGRAIEFVTGQFQALAKSNGDRQVSSHATCALDTEAMDTVFMAVRETLFMNNMMLSGGLKM